MAAAPQPLSAPERMAMMSNFAWGRDPEPGSDARVQSDAEMVCVRAKRGDFNSWGQLGVFSRRWMQVLYRMEIPDLESAAAPAVRLPG